MTPNPDNHPDTASRLGDWPERAGNPDNNPDKVSGYTGRRTGGVESRQGPRSGRFFGHFVRQAGCGLLHQDMILKG
jgi:hypothetical protein